MATPFILGIAAAAAAYAGRFGIQAWQAFKARPPTASFRRFYEGGFLPSMTSREAALILGVRYLVAKWFVKPALPVLNALEANCLPLSSWLFRPSLGIIDGLNRKLGWNLDKVHSAWLVFLVVAVGSVAFFLHSYFISVSK